MLAVQVLTAACLPLATHELVTDKHRRWVGERRKENAEQHTVVMVMLQKSLFSMLLLTNSQC
jgi:hypothetical protein